MRAKTDLASHMKNNALKALLLCSLAFFTACGGDDDDDNNGGNNNGGDDNDPPVVGDSRPTDPIAYEANTRFTLANGNYVVVPASYDSSHNTPAKLFVWLHGCGGYSLYDVVNVSPAANFENPGPQDWITLAPIGAENGCWDVNSQPAALLNAIADIKTHFNIDPKRVVLGGYSSGGDLGYRTIFYNALQFAGIVSMNTAPFQDTGKSSDEMIPAAAWKFNVYNLAHSEDTTYPVGPDVVGGRAVPGVEAEVQRLANAGFPATLQTVPGNHYDNAGEGGRPGTDADIRTYLLPKLGAGWTAP